jgi:hypothetical protein
LNSRICHIKDPIDGQHTILKLSGLKGCLLKWDIFGDKTLEKTIYIDMLENR